MQELIERKLGMKPIIRCTHLLESQASSPAMLKMNKRLTRQLDHAGYFRIQTRASVFYVKAIWCMSATIVAIYLALFSDFFYQHLILLNADTVYYIPYQHLAVSFLVHFYWDVVSNKYGKLYWTVLVHHWLTIFAAMMVLLCFYSPFTTWYGFTAVGLNFPTLFSLGFRISHSRKYPKLARKLLKFSAVWNIFTVFLNMFGQVFMIVYGSIIGKVHYPTVIIVACAMCGWLWDDYLLIRALIEFSNQRYENARIHRIEESKEVNVSGRVLCYLF